MNLWVEPWIPVRTREGRQITVSMSELLDTGDPAVQIRLSPSSLAFGVLEIVAGSLTLLLGLRTDRDFRRMQSNPPTVAQVQALIAASPLTPAFMLDGAGPRFMQEFQPDLTDWKRLSPLSLIMDYPGEETIKNNTDLFEKRSSQPDPVLSPAAAAIALFVLQANAPSGGRGHRTGLRGGGPLSVLVVPHDDASIGEIALANVCHGSEFAVTTAAEVSRIAPWTARTKTSEADDPPLSRDNFHAGQMFFGMPRRLRLDFEDANGRICALTGVPSPTVVTGVWTRHAGVNYAPVIDRHPFSAYRNDPKQGRAFAVKARSSGVRWDDFVGMVIGERGREITPPATVTQYRRDGACRAPHVLISGYATDKAKVLAYVQGRLPLPMLRNEDQRVACDIAVEMLVEATTLVARALRAAVWYAVVGDSRSIDQSSALLLTTEQMFWQDTRVAFTKTLGVWCQTLNEGDDIPAGWGKDWRRVLKRVALGVFDRVAVTDGSNPRMVKDGERVVCRVPQQRGYLLATLNGWSKNGRELFGKLNLEPPVRNDASQEKAA